MAIIAATYAERPELVEQVIDLIAESFKDDPHSLFFVSDPSKRKSKWQKLMQCDAHEGPQHIRHYLLPGGEAGAVFHMVPGPHETTKETEHAFMEDGVPAELLEMHREVGAMIEVQHDMYQQKHGEYFYLAWMGTVKSKQGQGHGSRLLQHLLAEADREGKYCFLVASNLDNRRLYARHGFVDMCSKEWRHETRPGLWCGLWFMERAPVVTR